MIKNCDGCYGEDFDLEKSLSFINNNDTISTTHTTHPLLCYPQFSIFNFLMFISNSILHFCIISIFLHPLKYLLSFSLHNKYIYILLRVTVLCRFFFLVKNFFLNSAAIINFIEMKVALSDLDCVSLFLRKTK